MIALDTPAPIPLMFSKPEPPNFMASYKVFTPLSARVFLCLELTDRPKSMLVISAPLIVSPIGSVVEFTGWAKFGGGPISPGAIVGMPNDCSFCCLAAATAEAGLSLVPLGGGGGGSSGGGGLKVGVAGGGTGRACWGGGGAC